MKDLSGLYGSLRAQALYIPLNRNIALQWRLSSYSTFRSYQVSKVVIRSVTKGHEEITTTVSSLLLKIQLATSILSTCQ
jgi:hypothetical protein